MPTDIVTTAQVANQRAFCDNMSKSTQSWWKRFSWYPRMQECHYRRIDQIYLESRQIYGDDHFLGYAARRRLAKKHALTPAIIENEMRQIEASGNLSVAPTTNGEYGRLKPTSLYFC